MFKKLRRRFLFLNIVIIFVMMMISFTSIYMITYNNVHSDISKELYRISGTSLNMNPGGTPDKIGNQNQVQILPKDTGRSQPQRPQQDPPQPDNAPPAPEKSVSLTILTDKQMKTTSVSSSFKLDEGILDNLRKTAFTQDKNKGTFKLGNNYWAYMKSSEYEGYRLVFLEISSQQAILTNLIYTFLIVSLLMLVVIYLISNFFANKSIKPVREAFEKQKQFIADASHELKTPLAVINTNIAVLLSDENESICNQSKWLHYIKSEAERMTRLTNDLLYLAQIDSLEKKVIYSDFDISKTVENVIMTMEAVIFEQNMELKYDIEPGLNIKGNNEQISQVVMILLDNAIKYTNVNGSIYISLKRQQNNVILSVTNSGEGIQTEYLGKIFDRFYRADKSRSRKNGGYGLGLAIAKAIIDQHQGEISVKSSTEEKTTTFQIIF